MDGGRWRRALVAMTALALLLAGVVATAWLTRAPSRRLIGEIRWGIHRLTTVGEDGLLADAALSRDGKRLVYIHSSNVWLRDVEREAATRVGLPEGVVPAEVDIFPDGDRLLLTSRGETAELGILSIEGGGWTRLAAACGNPRVSPDGDTVACARGSRLLAISAENGQERVARELGPGASVIALAWSPSGTRIAYIRLDEQAERWIGHAALELVNADGTGARSILRSMQVASLFGHGAVAWRDEDHLLVGSYGAMHPQIRELSLENRQELVRMIPTGELISFRMAHDVGRLLYLRRDLGHDVFLVDVTSRSSGEATARRITQGRDDDIPVAWMPDGRLAFVSNRGNDAAEFALYAVAPDGGEPVEIVEAPVASTLQVHFEDDDVYFGRSRRHILQGYSRRPLAGGDERDSRRPIWSHCVRMRPFTCVEYGGGKGYDISMLDPETRRPSGPRLHLPSSIWSDFALSPDGSTLAMLLGSEPIRFADVSTWETLSTAELGGAEFLAWTPDGSAVYVTERPNAELQGRLHVLPRDGTHRRVWTHEGAYVQHPVPSPDGTRVAVAVAVAKTDVYILDGL